jgi:PHD/YefM family antitoxin component YafN of YafNO toxin-antitoxin module
MNDVQYVTDVEGHKTAVIIPIEDYEEMLEDLHLGRVASKSENEPTRPFMELVEEMRANGEIDV